MKYLILYLVAILAAFSLCGCSHPDPVTRACQQMANYYPLDHFDVGECVKCTKGGSQYMWFMDPGTFECNNPSL